MLDLLNNLYVLFIGTIAIAVLGYKGRALSKSGSIATIIVGVFIANGFGWKGLLLIGIFFVTSSVWSKWKKDKDETSKVVEKGSQRDWIQVFANGGIPAVASILFIVSESSLFWIAFVTAIAVSTSDTWASEIGPLSNKRPLSIFSLKRVEKGTSGAISLLGTTAALFGSIIISLSSVVLWDGSIELFLMICTFGFIGCFLDTILGATVQVKYRCSKCGKSTEHRIHCNEVTIHTSGSTFVNNDVVNITSILFTSIIACIFYVFV
ncbi:DUF92 domain-containing protein [Sutcliffiella cohnii]|uniref:DUF92 domain-containing protein n=1 Tax=Sutcliffiella cohnii TaxID=33932 RepID=A0A223KSU9_9BACI|nr:DUF92 domain-containing protein [Sutcliffiella cohnii]AST92550.1 hypothetical protein BC6307_15250 [Sutcliffiella cohnii]MED4019110.1 DUF92 domain-containing protein [Sutcliffiella cohnii]